MRDPRQPVRSRSMCTVSSDTMSTARQAAVAVAEDVIEVLGQGRWRPGARAELVHSMAIRILGIDLQLGAVCAAELVERNVPFMAEAADMVLAHVRQATAMGEIKLRESDLYLTDPRIEPMLVPAYALVVTIG